MQSATDSASAMLNDLSIQYNRVNRQRLRRKLQTVVEGGDVKATRKKENEKVVKGRTEKLQYNRIKGKLYRYSRDWS